MRRLLVLAATVMACLLPVSAGVLDFDDILTNGGNAPMPASYGGFAWGLSDFQVESWNQYSTNYLNTYPFPSGSNAVYNNSGLLQVSMSGAPFIFNGAYFSGWDDENGTFFSTATLVSVSGYLGGNLVGTAATALPVDSFIWLDANMGPVDELVFTSSGSGKWWLMDNFTYQSTVPEPGSLLLCVAGLAVAATLKLRRR